MAGRIASAIDRSVGTREEKCVHLVVTAAILWAAERGTNDEAGAEFADMCSYVWKLALEKSSPGGETP
jgi:hypothetical protein